MDVRTKLSTTSVVFFQVVFWVLLGRVGLAQSWDLAADFSQRENPKGAWTFGWTTFVGLLPGTLTAPPIQITCRILRAREGSALRASARVVMGQVTSRISDASSMLVSLCGGVSSAGATSLVY